MSAPPPGCLAVPQQGRKQNLSSTFPEPSLNTSTLPHSIRGSQNVQLQGTIIVYNLDTETTREQLGIMYSRFGAVKEVSQSADRPSQKFVTFYDTRAAGAALQVRKGDGFRV